LQVGAGNLHVSGPLWEKTSDVLVSLTRTVGVWTDLFSCRTTDFARLQVETLAGETVEELVVLTYLYLFANIVIDLKRPGVGVSLWSEHDGKANSNSSFHFIRLRFVCIPLFSNLVIFIINQ